MIMNQIKNIGLPEKETSILGQKLNQLLANYQVYYMNLRGYHWNIQGRKFFELHLKFEELYNDALIKVDELAERVLTLGHTPTHTFQDYLNDTKVEVAHQVTDGDEAIQQILKALQELLIIEREILQLSGDIDDEGTNSLMSDYIREQEKLVWMLNAYMQ